MKVRLFQADQAGCRFYRLAEPARIARSEGVEADCASDIPLLPEPLMNQGLKVPAPIEDDVIVFQRPAKARTRELIEGFQRQGKAVVVDIDDDFSCLHPTHPAWRQFQPSSDSEVNWHNMQQAAKQADLVTVTTPALAERYGRHDRVAILPNCVPAALLQMPSHSDGHTLGWAGAAVNHPGDLEASSGGVGEALKRAEDWHFHIVGVVEDVRRRLYLAKEPSETGWLTPEGYQDALGQLDVGIVPLGETAFNRAKSYLKGLEYAARGVPFVASPLPEYRALAEEGVGLLAKDRARNWCKALLDLMRDESLRSECAEHGKAVVAERHTYETEGWRWLEAWQWALEHRRTGRPSVVSVA